MTFVPLGCARWTSLVRPWLVGYIDLDMDGDRRLVQTLDYFGQKWVKSCLVLKCMVNEEIAAHVLGRRIAVVSRQV